MQAVEGGVCILAAFLCCECRSLEVGGHMVCVCVCGPLLMAAVVWRRHVEFPVFENNPSLLQSNQPSIRSAQESPPPVSFLFYTLSSILASTLSFFFSSYCGQTWASCWFVSCSSKNLTQIHRYKLAVCSQALLKATDIYSGS